MWTQERWREFTPRLAKWMSIWEETGRRHGLTAEAGFLLGGETLGLADVVSAVLWSTMAERFAPLATLLDETAPLTAALSRRVAALPAQGDLAERTRKAYGEAYCGGQIEASLRQVLGS